MSLEYTVMCENCATITHNLHFRWITPAPSSLHLFPVEVVWSQWLCGLFGTEIISKDRAGCNHGNHGNLLYH